jgi:DNA-binding MarR family transcriptional regulator
VDSRALFNQMRDESRKQRSFIQIPSFLFHDLTAKKLNAWDVVVYMVLKSYCIEKDHCWYSVKTIAKKIAKSPSTVERAIRKLVKTGHISRVRRVGTSALTYLLSDVVNGAAIRRAPPVREPNVKKEPVEVTPPPPASTPQPESVDDII